MNTSINRSVINRFLQTRVRNQQEDFFHPPYMLEQQLLKAISHGDHAKANEVLININNLERARLGNTPLRSLKNSLICSCTLFTRAIIQGGTPPETAFELSDAFILEIEKIDQIEALRQLEYNMVYQFIETLNQDKETPTYSQPVHLAIAYIHDRILHDLSLETISAQVHVNPSYLSHLFKKEVGVSITEFINKKRIEESKFFLLHTNSTISDIALLFRFCNQSYYTTIFKKYCDVSPKEFRKERTDG